MIVSELTREQITQRLVSSKGLRIRTGPLTFAIQTRLQFVIEGLFRLYANYPLVDADTFADYYVKLKTPRSLRRWYKPQVLFDFDGRIPFKPLPLAQAFPMLEWGMNWCIANHCHQWLILHAAVIAKNNHAVIMPAPPGSGKSTLCAGLVGRGWRLFSDELAIFEIESGKVIPMPRPIGLKNQSIEVIRTFLPDAVIGPICHDTRKGTVAHMAVSENDSVNEALATPAWVIFPQYCKDSEATLLSHPQAHSMLELANNAFNNHITGLNGFHLLADLVDKTEIFDFRYSRLEDAVEVFEQLVERKQT